jgi:hypothetical protein
MRARWQPTAVFREGKKRCEFEKNFLTFIIDVDSGYKSRVIEPQKT